MAHDDRRSFWRPLRALRGWLRRHGDPRRIQRSAPLEPEDATGRRSRRHVLVDLVHEHCPGSGVRVVEIGTYTGRTAAHLHKYCPQIERLYTVDLEKPDPARDRIRGLERVVFIQERSDLAAKAFEDESVDLVFIDGDHSEEGARRDLGAWVPKVRPGGVIAGHDYDSPRHPGVRRAVDRFFAQHPQPIRTEANMVWWTLK